MSVPKFSVGEVCLLQSVDHPELNGEVTVLAFYPERFTNHLMPNGKLVCNNQINSYVLDVETGEGSPFWAETALRKKHDPSDYSFHELMDNIKDMATA